MFSLYNPTHLFDPSSSAVRLCRSCRSSSLQRSPRQMPELEQDICHASRDVKTHEHIYIYICIYKYTHVYLCIYVIICIYIYIQKMGCEKYSFLFSDSTTFTETMCSKRDRWSMCCFPDRCWVDKLRMTMPRGRFPSTTAETYVLYFQSKTFLMPLRL